MIRITCQSCRAQLDLDDAFAGGVCRCRHCGHMQKVPRNARPLPETASKHPPATGPAKPRTTLLLILLAGLLLLSAALLYYFYFRRL